MKNLIKLAAIGLSIGTACAPAQALVIGTADSTSSLPFGSTTSGYYYQQIYSASSLSAMNISQISFYNRLAPGGTTRPGTYVLYLSTSTLNVASFDETNSIEYPYLDSSFTEVFNGELPSLANGRLDIALSTLFNYNPAAGNLVLTIKKFDLASGGGIQLDADNNNGLTNLRMSSYKYNFNQGLVTGFNDIAAVPEPATWAMMMGGLALIGVSMRRRRTTLSFA